MKTTTIGSAHANAWLHALGNDLPEEIIILPGDGPKSVGTTRRPAPISWAADLLLEAYPSRYTSGPSSGVLFLVYEVPDGSPPGQLRLLDLHGRTLLHKTTAPGPGMMQWNVQGLTPGLYLAELRVQGLPPQQVKVAVQH